MNALKDPSILTIIFVATLMMLIFVWEYSSNYKNPEENHTKLFYPEGKAILTSGRVCIINTAALESEELAIKMTKACVNEYKKKSANLQ
jgi:hypothetical protein